MKARRKGMAKDETEGAEGALEGEREGEGSPIANEIQRPRRERATCTLIYIERRIDGNRRWRRLERVRAHSIVYSPIMAYLATDTKQKRKMLQLGHT